MNIVCMTGRLTADPELRSTTSGKTVTSVHLAVWQSEDRTDFFPIIAWEKQAEKLCQKGYKGQRINVTGRLQNRKYTDKTGIERIATEIVASYIDYLDKRESSSDVQSPAQAKKETPSEYTNTAYQPTEFTKYTSEDFPF